MQRSKPTPPVPLSPPNYDDLEAAEDRLQQAIRAARGRAKPRNLLAVNPQFEAVGSEDALLELEREVADDRSMCWIRSRVPFQRLLASLRRRSRRSPAMADPFAPYVLLLCVIRALQTRAIYVEGRTSPGQMTKKDWRTAIDAVATLRELTLKSGLRLRYANGAAGESVLLPSGWLSELETQMRREADTAKRAYVDEFASDREAVRDFVEYLLLHWDEAPPTMAESFAELIDYPTDSIRRHLKSWEAAYRSNSLV